MGGGFVLVFDTVFVSVFVSVFVFVFIFIVSIDLVLVFEGRMVKGVDYEVVEGRELGGGEEGARGVDLKG